MPTDAPPSYHAAVQQPALNITAPSGETHRANSFPSQSNRQGLERATSNESFMSTSTDGGLGINSGIPEDGRRSMDDELRELPKGWVRCFDEKTEHHFYVDEATKRAIWVHPYDDPEYLQSLPDIHPANPNSAEAQAVRKHAEEEQRLSRKVQADRAGSGGRGTSTRVGEGAPNQTPEKRNWFQKKKDGLIGTKEERATEKEARRKARAEQERKEQEAYEAYQKRRADLLRRQLTDPSIRARYASDPYSYSAPIGAYSRAGGMYSSPYGYGYGGGYGRRGYGGYGGYGGGMGMGLPLMGGLGGGLLLGSMMGGGLGGGFGGGGFGGCGGGGGFGGCGGGGGAF